MAVTAGGGGVDLPELRCPACDQLLAYTLVAEAPRLRAMGSPCVVRLSVVLNEPHHCRPNPRGGPGVPVAA